MKKVRYPILVLVLLFSAFLSGCSLKKEPVSPAESIAEQKSEDVSIHLLRSGYPLGAASDHGYYFLQYRDDASQNIYYIDYVSRQKIVLCNQPNCQHNSDTCSAWIPYSGSTAGIYEIGGKLYIIHYGSVSPADYQLFGAAAAPGIEVRSADGSNPTTLLQLSSNSYFSGNLATDGYYLYGILKEVQSSEDENVDEKNRLVKISLESGNLETLCETDQLEPTIAGASGSYLAISHYQVDTANGSMLPSTVCYESYDVETGNISPLCSFSRADGTCICVGDDLFYIDKSTYEARSYSIKTGAEQALYTLPMENYSDLYCSYALNDSILLLLYPKDPDANVVHALLSADSGRLFEITRSMSSDETSNGKTQMIEIAAETEDDFLILSGVHYQNVSFKVGDEESIALPSAYYEFSIIDRADFINNSDGFIRISDSENQL